MLQEIHASAAPVSIEARNNIGLASLMAWSRLPQAFFFLPPVFFVLDALLVGILLFLM